jgi:hypothetical protein
VNRRFRFRRRLTIALALSVSMLMVAVPVAVAQISAGVSQDLRSPDARDAAASAQQATEPTGGSQDMRSPDARDAASTAQQATQPSIGYRDLRSPDARDAAEGMTTGSQSVPVPAPVDSRTVIAVEDGGSGTLAIVFSACALFIALLAVGFIALSRRPRPRWTTP